MTTEKNAMKPAAWPVLKTYDKEHLLRVAMPLGGIGTGTVSLGGRGDLRDWEIMNVPAKGYVPQPVVPFMGLAPFFALHLRDENGAILTHGLEGPLDPVEYEGSHGCRTPNHGLPRFKNAEFAAAYPLGQVKLSDPGIPVDVRIEAFNPMVPGDADKSGMPVAVLRYVLTNKTDHDMTATVCGSVMNYIGADGSKNKPDWLNQPVAQGAKQNKNEFRSEDGLQGIYMTSEGVAENDQAWGTMALTTPDTGDVSYRTAWAELTWGNTFLDFWDDFSDGGKLEDRKREKTESPMASLAVSTELPANSTRQVTFLLTWHFPNRQTWTPAKLELPGLEELAASEESKAETSCCADGGSCEANTIGNYYCGQYSNAWDAAQKIAPQLMELERETVEFVSAFCESDLPEVVKEAALFNLSTLRTQTCFRTPDGRFFGYEGCCDQVGCCYGSCTHVWNYEQATAFLFGDLVKTMRDSEFAQATDDRGKMSGRINLPIERAKEFSLAHADGQMGCLIRLYRDWQFSGDDDFLRRLWPHAKRALEFCWVEGGWDGNVDGLMEGCQHNTMDVEYYGPNPQMEVWYLGALRATEEMAHYMGDDDFAEKCRDLFEKGKAWTDENLFNGDYYEHHIQPPLDPAKVAEGTFGPKPTKNPILQLGSGCLVDQLVGQHVAHSAGLGHLLDSAQIKQTYRSIKKYNWKDGFTGHFNNARSFVMGDEKALLMATYPKGRRPEQPFPYYNEVMSGFEYVAAIGMLQEGLIEDGLECIEAIRERYDGRRRNPFDEAECGHHYARAMASWTAVPVLTGFQYSAVTKIMKFATADKTVTWFWSTGHAWGTFRHEIIKADHRYTLHVMHGEVRIEHLIVGDQEVADWSTTGNSMNRNVG